ncbi:FMN-binding negative transcriptional regulator [Sulfitobacter sabulilitoris]|uniref:FMN-binding negative transcriptional regulator n=1 Tax=Sulfitobacter sabulilitoris TaxID=2562655 RepID=A0A5S3PKK2_9RHOB|nr:FMN-binding negative transcriptional regulator [Sulfitobacter sabulilitoris]TMM52726.1 FMN-binding negative transcriptional regulator [Sulfitobacter sabulilitoris]
MHPNPVFHTQDADHNLAFARDRAFGMLAVNAPQGPLVSHVPFLLDEDGETVWLHLVKSNPIVRGLGAPVPARIAVTGPDSYISPDWYGIADQVPTWNYVAVHVTGMLEMRPQSELRDLLDRQSRLFEHRLLPKPPWTSSKMTEGAMDRMMRAIVPCALRITGVDGTWKLNQNKPADVRLKAADHVEGYGLGTDLIALAALMRGADRQD